MTAEQAERWALAAKSPENRPKELASGGTIMDTPESIERYAMLVVYTALELQSKGIKVTRHSPLKAAQVKYGVPGRTAKVAYVNMTAMLKEKGII